MSWQTRFGWGSWEPTLTRHGRGSRTFPALLASPDVEMTAVCTTRPESAEEARQHFGAKLAFHDFREMAAVG